MSGVEENQKCVTLRFLGVGLGRGSGPARPGPARPTWEGFWTLFIATKYCKEFASLSLFWRLYGWKFSASCVGLLLFGICTNVWLQRKRFDVEVECSNPIQELTLPSFLHQKCCVLNQKCFSSECTLLTVHQFCCDHLNAKNTSEVIVYFITLPLNLSSASLDPFL